jgi:hypothetical protein
MEEKSRMISRFQVQGTVWLMMLYIERVKKKKMLSEWKLGFCFAHVKFEMIFK